MIIKRALVVDDSKSARFSLKKLLEKESISVDFAESAGDALNYLATNHPDVVFMDHLMPGMDGFEATKAIKNNASTAHLPVVMCTSKEGSEYAQQAIACGATGILPKPAPAATLTAMLSQINNQSQASTDGVSSEEPSAPLNAINTITLHGIVARMINDQLGELRTEFSKSSIAMARTEVEQALGHQSTQLRHELKRSAESKVKEVAHTLLQKAANELIETRLSAMKEELFLAFEKRLNHIEANVQQNNASLDSALTEEIKTIARFSAASAAGDTAQQAAEDAAIPIARAEAEQTASNIAHHLETQFSQALQDAKTSLQLWAVIAAGIGVTAAITVYCLV